LSRRANKNSTRQGDTKLAVYSVLSGIHPCEYLVWLRAFVREDMYKVIVERPRGAKEGDATAARSRVMRNLCYTVGYGDLDG
jgi:hypothetical protein